MTIIPALQKQKHRSGEAFKMQGQDFNVITDNERLLKVYKLIANKKGFLITNTSSNKIQLFHDETLQDETYVLEVEKTISIKSNSYNGFIYGFQTLIKLLLESNIIEAQTIKDFPFLEERALHLDCGRKYFSFSWIKKLIEDLAWRNMNTLQLHFSDNKGFRIECDTYPSITSEAFLSKKQIRELIDYAHLFGIDVIPSLDSPGHLKAALETLPKYQLPNNDGNGLDITNADARQFMRNLYHEYAELFYDSKYFNIGGDEFIDFEDFSSYPFLKEYAINELKITDGTGIDTYIEFLNEMIELLEEKGYIVRLWNDGLHRLNQNELVKLKESAEICYWTKYNQYMAPLSTFEEKGYQLINYNADYFYYVLHVEAGVKIIDPQTWYETWHPYEFSGKQLLENKDLLQGASYSIWCDAPEIATETEIYEHTEMPLWAIADRMWNPHDQATLTNLEAKIKQYQ